MPFFSSIPTWGWVDIFSNIAVLVALCGESHWALKWLIPNKSEGKASVKWRREKLKKKFELLLILGIAGEVGCLPLSLWESSNANKLAGQANERASTNELQVLGLKSNNLALSIELEKLKQPRTITEKQKNDFIDFIKFLPKSQVSLYKGADNTETGTYKNEIEDLLTNAGYTIKNDFPGDLINDSAMGGYIPAGASVFLVVNTNTFTGNVFYTSPYMYFLQKAFSQIKIDAPFMNGGEGLHIKTNQLLIIITEKR